MSNPTPDAVEGQFTLLTAVARYDVLRTRDALAAPDEDGEDGEDATASADPATAPLTRAEALEVLALSEVIARKATYGRQLSVRSARRAGASWSQIGAALGTSKQAAWEAHNRWIDGQAKQEGNPGHWGWDERDLSAARTLAGEPDEGNEGNEENKGNEEDRA
ncbi:hypothetical protein [Streptomyces sp. NPDC088261]|uniref:hypothetical protein n=1 Tax=Streptomyces sp. NPDC088261 TaxID=3365851 RepID=UPI003822B750